jgi:carbon-monoxide dehydrogenase medium subunit
MDISRSVRKRVGNRTFKTAEREVSIFGDVSKLIADPSVRNMGTIGGNLAHGDAANDHPAVMLALRAQITATGAGDQQRVIPVDEFFQGFYTTALQPDEILTEIRIPSPFARKRWCLS